MELFLRVLPRLTWAAFLTVLVVWICRCGAGLRTWSQEEPGPAMSLHYLFMGLAWPVCMTEAILSYRAPLVPFRQRSSIKYLHVTLQTLVGACIVLGLAFVIAFKGLLPERHFFSIHSWVGVLAITIYVVQYSAGFYAYIASSWPPARRAAFYSTHRWLGCLGLLSGLYAATLGLAEVQIFDLWATGYRTFSSPAVYYTGSVLVPVMGVLLFVQAAAVMLTHVVLEQQYLPAPVLAKGGLSHAPNGGAA